MEKLLLTLIFSLASIFTSEDPCPTTRSKPNQLPVIAKITHHAVDTIPAPAVTREMSKQQYFYILLGLSRSLDLVLERKAKLLKELDEEILIGIQRGRYKLIIGPFLDNKEAKGYGEMLGQPFWIITEEDMEFYPKWSHTDLEILRFDPEKKN